MKFFEKVGILFWVVVIIVIGGRWIGIFGSNAPATAERTKAESVEAVSALPALPRVGMICDSKGDCIRGVRKVVTREDLGERWPLTVDAALLVCLPEVKALGQLMVVDGKPWAVNGATQSFARKWALTVDVDGQKLPVKAFDQDREPDADRLWARHPVYEEARVNWSVMIDAVKEMGCG